MTGVKPSGRTGRGRRDQCVKANVFLNELMDVVITVVIQVGWDEQGQRCPPLPACQGGHPESGSLKHFSGVRRELGEKSEESVAVHHLVPLNI